MKKIAYYQMFKNELNHAWYRGTRALLFNQLKNYTNKNSKILDAGCGTGGTIKLLKKEGYRNIYGVDNSMHAIYFCKKRSIKNIKYADIDKLPYKKDFFDAVICLDVMYHKGVNPRKVASEIYRVLKKGGVFYSQEPAFNWLKSKHDLAIETERRFTKQSLQKVVRGAGFYCIKSSYFNAFFLLPIALSRVKNKYKVKKETESDVTRLPYTINILLLFVLSLEAYLIKFINLPFGLSVISLWKK